MQMAKHSTPGQPSGNPRIHTADRITGKPGKGEASGCLEEAMRARKHQH